MSLTLVGPVMFVSGLLGLAGLLYVLQRLRVRHREVEVVTTLFWRDAIEERRARVLTRRFRHPWAYVLLLLIMSLIWLMIAGPQRDPGNRHVHIILLDGSAVMTQPGRFEEAVNMTRSLAGRLPDAQREVRLIAGASETILAPGEPLPLLDARLRKRGPAAAPGGFEAAVQTIAATHDASRSATVHLIGLAPFGDAVASALPDNVTVSRPFLAGDNLDNRSIVSLGVGNAKSGAWDVVDATFQVHPQNLPTDAVSITLGTQPILSPAERLDAGRFVIRDIPAAGQTFTVRLLDGGVIAFDDEASIILPDRPRISVFVGPTMPRLLRLAIQVDPAVTLVDSRAEAEVVVGANADADFVIAPNTNDAAFRISTDSPDDTLDTLASGLIDELAIRQIDAERLAEQSGREIRLDVESADARRVRVWARLFNDDLDFPKSRACPVFVANVVRWLAARPDVIAWAAAGEPIPSNAATIDRSERAGEYTTIDGRTILTSLGTHATESPATPPPHESVRDSRGIDLLGLIGLLVLLLLTTEWILYRRGRIP